MKRRISMMIALTFFYVLAMAGDGKITSPAELKSVTVYRSGAELQHIAAATLKQGNNELVIDNISNNIDINSIQIKTPAAVTIMGVEFANDYLKSPEKTPRIKLLEDSLDRVQKDGDKLKLSLTNATDLLDVLKANRDIKGSQTGLSVAELMKLMDYYKVKSGELQTEIAQLKDKQKKLVEVAGKIQNQIDEEESKNVSTAGKLILQLSVAASGKYDFNISYIAKNAYWTPFYDVRVENIKSPLKVIYKAKVTQTTGIDWKQVKLSLSTAMPSQWGNAPILQQWYLGYINPIAAMNKSLAMNTLQGRVAGVAAQPQLDEVVVTGYGTDKEKNIRIRGVGSVTGDNKPLYVVNGNVMSSDDYTSINPSSIKKIDVLKGASATAMYGARASNGVVIITLKDGLEDYVSVADNTMNVTFDIDMPYDAPTTGKEQTAILKSFDVPADYQHYSVPKLDKDAYLLAKVKDWEKLNLLPGNANIIFEGTYVGKSFIDPASTQDTLNLTLGRDKRVVIKRDKIIDFSSVKFLGSNKLQKFTYEITVKNNKNEQVDLLLKDQFPLSSNKEIEVNLIDTNGADVNAEIGVLNWNITLAAGETKKVRYSYTVKYPKDKTVNL